MRATTRNTSGSFALALSIVLLSLSFFAKSAEAVAQLRYCSFTSPPNQQFRERLFNNTTEQVALLPQPNEQCFSTLPPVVSRGSVRVLVDQGDWLFVRNIEGYYRQGWVKAGPFRPRCADSSLIAPLKPDWLMPACDWTAAFKRDSGWGGADATYSTQLKDGRQLFLFGDTYFGETVDGLRHWPPTGNWFMRNTAALAESRSPRSVSFQWGGSPTEPQSLFIPPDGRGWYWPGEAISTNTQTGVILNQYEFSNDPMFAYGRQIGVWMADISADNRIQVNSYRRLFADTNDLVVGGAAVMEEAPYFYIYSNAQTIEQGTLTSNLKISRVHQNADIGDFSQWEHFNGIYGWSSTYAGAGTVPALIANEFSVQRLSNGTYLMVVQFAGQIGFNVSPSPVGPWTWMPLMFPTELEQPGILSYNAKAHPELSDRRGLLISYNVNSSNPIASYTDPWIYRPRFFRVPWSYIHTSTHEVLRRSGR